MVNLTDLIQMFLSIKTKKEMENFLYGLFTLRELEEMEQRLKIVKMLKKGISQRRISQKLGVGIATVTRGSNEIKKGRFISV